MIAGFALLMLLGIAGEALAYGPSNDSFDYAATMNGWSGRAREWTTAEATIEDGEPSHAGVAGGHSIWYRWTPDQTATAVISTNGSTFDTLLAVYTGRRVNRLTHVASDDDGAGAEIGTSLLTFSAQAGVTYYIAVDGAAGATGRVEISWNRPPPANDNLGRATQLSGTSGSTAGSNQWATNEPGEPGHYGDITWESVWYRWTAPADLAISFDTIGSAINPRFDVYTGSRLADLAWLTSGGGQTRATSMQVVAGTTYIIRVEGSNYTDIGAFVFTWKAIQPPPNDDFAAAQVLPGAEGSTPGTGFGAGSEPGEPSHPGSTYAPGHSVWYRWVAPVTGRAVMETGARGGLAVYTGTAVGSLRAVPHDAEWDQSSLWFDAVRGATYSIAVDQPYEFTLSWRYSRPPNDAFMDREYLIGTSGQTSGYNASATAEAGEPSHAGNPAARSVWYRYRASYNGTATFTTAGSTFDTVLAVYVAPWSGGSVGAITHVGSNDNDGTATSSRVSVRVTEGQYYAIAVDGRNGAVGNTALAWSFVPEPPPNDRFAAAELISGPEGTVHGRTIAATKESGEPNHGGVPGGRSIWYRWVAPATGPAAFATYGHVHQQSIDTALAVYTGSSVGSLTLVAGNNDYPEAGRGSRVDISVTRGATYYIAVDGVQAQEGHTRLRWTMPPLNDAFDRPQVLWGRSGTETGTSLRSTRQAYEAGFDTDGWGSSVWYRWAAPANEVVQFTVDSSTFEPLFQVYTGETLQSLEPVGGAGETAPGARSVVRFTARAGVTYRFRVVSDGWGAFSLDWRPAAAPANDNFARAVSIAGESGTATAQTQSATNEPGEPTHDWEHGGQRTVWYSYTAARDGTLELNTAGSNFATVLAVYTGTDVSELTRVVGHYNPFDPDTVLVRVGVRAGQTYRVVVGGAYPGWGSLVLNWRMISAPANDNFAAAAQLAGSNGSLTASNRTASREAGEPIHAFADDAAASLWYRWTAPATGSVSFDTGGTTLDSVLAVYRGSSVGALTRVRQNNNASVEVFSSRVAFTATAGTTYFVAVDSASSRHTGIGGHVGDLVLNWHAPATPPNDAFALARVLNPGGYGGSRIVYDLDDNHGATNEAGEPNHGGFAGGRSVWYRWTAPYSDTFTVHTRGSTFDTALAVYSGSDLASLTLHRADDNSGGGTASRVEFAAVQGTAYWIAVDGRGGAAGEIVLYLNPVAVPLNDDFGAADVVTGTSGSRYGTTSLATGEYREPSHAYARTQSVWYRWTAPTSGTFAFRIAEYNLVMAAYSGSSLETLVPLSQIEGSVVRIGAVAGSTYHIAVNADIASGPFTLSWSSTPAPSNDNFGAATALTAASGRVTVSTVGASRQPGEPVHASRIGGASVWYTWTAPSSGTASFETTGTPYDTTMGVYTGSGITSLIRVAASDNAATSLTSRVRIPVTAGSTYRIAIDGRATRFIGSSAPVGNLTLAWRIDPPPANDAFAAGRGISGPSGSAAATTAGARLEPGEPRHASAGSDASIWFFWKAPATGTVTFDTARSTARSAVAVYTGTSVGALTVIHRSDDTGARSPSVSFAARSGTTYRIAVDGSSGAIGPVTLDWRMAPPANDAFASARTISGQAATATATNIGATKESGEPAHAGNAGARSIWFRWTAPATESVTFHTSGSNFNTLLAAYTGSSPGSLTTIAANNDTAGLTTSLVKFEARAGVTYAIAVDGYAAAWGDVRLSWHPTPDPPNNDFVEAQTISSPVGAAAGTTFDANREAGEPNHAGVSGGHSVWYRWVAPRTGTVTMIASSGDFDTLLAAYRGTAVNTVTLVAANNDSGGRTDSSVTFRVTAGTEYRIAVDGASGTMGAFNLSWNLPPLNDNWSAAQAIAGETGSVSGDTVGATMEPGEPNYEGQLYSRTVWYAWTAPRSMHMAFTVGSSVSDWHEVGIYVGGSLDTLEFAGYHHVSARIPVTSGTAYWIRIEESQGTPFTLSWAPTTTPPNENFASAQELSGASGSVSGTVRTATREVNEPPHDLYGTEATVWYRWTAPASGRIWLRVDGTASHEVAAYRGTSVDALTLAPPSTDGSGSSNGLWYDVFVLDAVAGETYHIAVGGHPGAPGFTLTWEPGPAAN